MFSKLLVASILVATTAAQSQCPVPTIDVCCGAFASGTSDAVKALLGPNSKLPEGDFGQLCTMPTAIGCPIATQKRACQYFAERLGYAAGCATA